MKQKLIKIGNSTGIILPKHLQNEVGLTLGDSVSVGAQANTLVITPLRKEKKSGSVDAKFMKMVDEFLTEHEDVLEKLANR